MKIFLRREGGLIATYCPQGQIDTDHLPSEEVKQIVDVFQSERLKSMRRQRIEKPDAFEYFIRLEQADGLIEEFHIQESDLDSESQKAFHLLMKRIQQAIKDS